MTWRWPDRRAAGEGLDRRTLLGLLAACMGSAGAPWRGEPPVKSRIATEEVFFHHDALHRDLGGLCVPYRAPAGARALAPLAAMSEAQIRHAIPYL